jgi:TorA-specific chaperone
VELNVFQNATRLRDFVYSFLSRGYLKEADEKYLSDMNNNLDLLSDYNTNTNEQMLSKGIETMRNLLSKADSFSDLAEELAFKYATLFLNVSPNDVVSHVHPYESVYLSPNNLVMQEQRDEVLELYAEFQLGVTKEFKEPEDHIAVELAFLQKLNELVYRSLEEGNLDEAVSILKAHRKFMEQHLLRWVHLLGRDLLSADADGFYAALAHMTMGFVKVDYSYVSEMVEYLENGGQ